MGECRHPSDCGPLEALQEGCKECRAERRDAERVLFDRVEALSAARGGGWQAAFFALLTIAAALLYMVLQR